MIKLLVPSKPTPGASAAVAPAIPITPLPATQTRIVIPPTPLPQGAPTGPALGFDFRSAEQVEATNLIAKDGLCALHVPSQFTKRYLWVYLWFENTVAANVAIVLGEIVLYRDRTVIGKFPFGDVFPATAAAGAAGPSILNLSSGSTAGALVQNVLDVRPLLPTATEPVLSQVSPISFNAEIDKIDANLLNVNSNVASYRLILACLSTSP